MFDRTNTRSNTWLTQRHRLLAAVVLVFCLPRTRCLSCRLMFSPILSFSLCDFLLNSVRQACRVWWCRRMLGWVRSRMHADFDNSIYTRYRQLIDLWLFIMNTGLDRRNTKWEWYWESWLVCVGERGRLVGRWKCLDPFQRTLQHWTLNTEVITSILSFSCDNKISTLVQVEQEKYHSCEKDQQLFHVEAMLILCKQLII